jgi:hypothetical protein
LTGIPITRTDEDLKSLPRELTRNFIANPFIRYRDQYGIHLW